MLPCYSTFFRANLTHVYRTLPHDQTVSLFRRVRVNGFVFLSGHVAMSLEGEPLYGSVAQQTRHIMHAIRETLARAHTTLNNIVKVQVWLSQHGAL